MDYDVVVVGAGPVGSAVARDVARQGFRVLMLEEHRVVGQPRHCSGLVTPRALEISGVSDSIVINKIRGAVIHSASGRELAIDGGGTKALVIDREALDMKLLEQAQECGAELLLGAKLVNIEREDSSLRLGINRDGRGLSVATKLLVGADGAHSMVARWLGQPPLGDRVQALGVEAELDAHVADFVDIFVGRTVAPGWFGWIIPLGDGRARLGIGDADHGAKPVRQLLDRLVQTFPQQFAGARLNAFYSGTIPLYCAMKICGDNVLLVGDAARQVKPTSGGGIYTGLVCARHCAHTAIKALESEDFSGAFLSQYEARWKAELSSELDQGLSLRKIFVSLSDAEIDSILSILGRTNLMKVITRYGDIDFPSRAFGQLVKVAPGLLSLLRMPSLWLSGLKQRGGKDFGGI